LYFLVYLTQWSVSFIVFIHSFLILIYFPCSFIFFFFFNDTATTEIYTLSLHDALPILSSLPNSRTTVSGLSISQAAKLFAPSRRSEEHTSELQSHLNLVCRLLLEKKKNKIHKKIQQIKTKKQKIIIKTE